MPAPLAPTTRSRAFGSTWTEPRGADIARAGGGDIGAAGELLAELRVEAGDELGVGELRLAVGVVDGGSDGPDHNRPIRDRIEARDTLAPDYFAIARSGNTSAGSSSSSFAHLRITPTSS